MNRDKMHLRQQAHIHSTCIRWGGIYSSEPDGFFHGARVNTNKVRPYRKGSDVRDRIKV